MIIEYPWFEDQVIDDPLQTIADMNAAGMRQAMAIATLEAEVEALRSEVARQHAEILRLRMYAPGGRVEHVIKVTHRIGSTNFAFYGIKMDEEFESWGRPYAEVTE